MGNVVTVLCFLIVGSYLLTKLAQFIQEIISPFTLLVFFIGLMLIMKKKK